MDNALMPTDIVIGRGMQSERLADESLHLGVAAGWTDLKITPASGASLGGSAPEQIAVVATTDATTCEQPMIESLDVSDHARL